MRGGKSPAPHYMDEKQELTKKENESKEKIRVVYTYNIATEIVVPSRIIYNYSSCIRCREQSVFTLKVCEAVHRS